jgi:hypothetical protein
VVPSAEICGDGLDNDCDGPADEGCVGDRAWQDSDGNGLQDAGETGAPGVIFFLRSGTTGALVAVQVSDSSGHYYFSGVPPGTYFIEVSPPLGFTPTASDVGADDALDSDFDPETLASPVFTLANSTLDVDCGIITAPGS